MKNNIAINGNFEIAPCDEITDIEIRPGYKKMELSSAQKIQMGSLMQQIPALIATDILSGAYVMTLPEGLPDAVRLMRYKDTNGLSNILQGADGKIVGHASLYELSAQTALLNVFNIMSIASGQYFLAEINSELKTMNQNINKILEFLYEDKKAELMSEISFVNSACQNYSSVMEHEQQRLATLVSLQESKKVAMKDIEFYISNLDSTVSSKTGSDVASWVDDIFRIKDCLELSMRLYSMSTLMETYYAQNFDNSYISDIEKEATVYIGKCEKRMLSCFSKLLGYIQSYKEMPLKKIDKPALERRVGSVIDLFGIGSESETLRTIRSVLHASQAKTEYYLSGSGDLYLKTE